MWYVSNKVFSVHNIIFTSAVFLLIQTYTCGWIQSSHIVVYNIKGLLSQYMYKWKEDPLVTVLCGTTDYIKDIDCIYMTLVFEYTPRGGGGGGGANPKWVKKRGEGEKGPVLKKKFKGVVGEK